MNDLAHGDEWPEDPLPTPSRPVCKTIVLRKVPKEVFDAFRREAHAKGESTDEAVTMLMRAYVETAQVDRTPVPVHSGGPLHAALSAVTASHGRAAR